ncbi:MAG: hypothetical protein LIP23_08420, partial [Planctomycetes bacterium]|nr:hypothetical protein [Planctomycetota bacterium]
REAFQRGKKVGIGKIFANTIWRFFHNYFFRGEIIDGAYGFLASCLSSAYTFDKYTRLWGLWVAAKKDGKMGDGAVANQNGDGKR